MALSRTLRTLIQAAGSVVAIGLDTVVCHLIVNVNPTTVGFVYLLTVLIIATEWGLFEATVASLVATTCYNFFFLPPLYTWTIADPQNWVALFAFLATSLIVSQLSERAKRRRDEAISRQLDLEQLHSVSRAILLMDRQSRIGVQIAREVRRVYELSAVAIYDRATGETYRGGEEEPADWEQALRDAAIQATLSRDEEALVTIAPFTLGGQPIGALALKGRKFSDAALHSLSNLVAIGLERARGQEAASRAEAARHSEEFKSALLDAIAHEFKTPLTGIKAATSGTLSGGVTNPEHVHELMLIVDKAADRLLVLISEAIHLARIEAGKMRLQKRECQVGALLRDSVQQMQTVLEGRACELRISPELPAVHVDQELLGLVLRQLLDNAGKYSPVSAPIRISAEMENGLVLVRIWNGGPGIPEWEKSRLFEKFYRGTGAGRSIAGTGMGLAIAREIMLAHGGDIRVESGPGKGVEFTLLLAVAKEVPAS